jgi:hypothetical protein
MRIVGKNQQAKVGDLCQNDEFTVTVSVSREEFELIPMYRSVQIALSEVHPPKDSQEYPSEARGYDKIPLDGGPNAWPYEHVNIEGEGHLYKPEPAPDFHERARLSRVAVAESIKAESPESESMTSPIAGISAKDGVVQVGAPPPAYSDGKSVETHNKPTPGHHTPWKPKISEE